MRRLFALTAVAALAVSVPGCKQNQYATVTTGFADAVKEHSAALRAMYGGLNEGIFNVYVAKRLTDASLSVADNELCIDGTTLRRGPSVWSKPRLSEASIAKRTGLIDLLGSYASTLAALANGTAPKDLADSLGNLQTSFAQAAKDSGGSAKDFDITAPLTSIGATIGRIYLERRRTAKLTELIESSEPAVNKLLDVLSDDTVRTRNQALDSANVEYHTWLNYYNHIRVLGIPHESRRLKTAFVPDTCADAKTTVAPATAPQASSAPSTASPLPIAVHSVATAPPAAAIRLRTDAQFLGLREAVLKHAVDARARYLALSANDPQDAIKSLREAHAKLVAFAKQPDRPESAQELFNAIAQYRADADTLFKAYRTLTTGQ